MWPPSRTEGCCGSALPAQSKERLEVPGPRHKENPITGRLALSPSPVPFSRAKSLHSPSRGYCVASSLIILLTVICFCLSLDHTTAGWSLPQ
jgi:hypothetical protein